MKNPLLAETTALPAFDKIKPEDVASALGMTLAENREQIEHLLKQREFTWDNLLKPLENLDNRLHIMWSPVAHIHAVADTAKWRSAYEQGLPELTAYSTEIGQNTRLYEAIQSIKARSDYETLTVAQKKVITDLLRDFHLSGVGLNEQDKQRYAELQQKLAVCGTNFSNNILDTTDHWFHFVKDEAELEGIPAHACIAARALAAKKGEDGWCFNLEYPSYFSVITYAKNRALRKLFYTAYCTRASDAGPHDVRYDNSAIMEEILKLRHELATLLGFSDYADYSLATKMAHNPQDVLDFLYSLAKQARPVAEQELKELQTFAASTDGLTDLQAWDIGYYSEKLCEHQYAISQEALRPYFPADSVLKGLFSIVQKLFGILIKERNDVPSWHPDAQFFEIYDETQQLRGQFYLDLYARPQKRGGAWMDNCHSRLRTLTGEIQIPLAYLTCNFTPPQPNEMALLTHEEVVTLFHEFGHGLHHLLTKMEDLPVSGISGVPWDVVEFPSQFLENWCWDPRALALISSHHQTGEPLPEALLKKLLAAKNFHAGLHLLRQIEFSLFDFRIHQEYNPALGGRVQMILDDVRSQIAVLSPPSFNRFQHSFSHIFSGGYAAGYYSYKWAEVLASDAFSKFEENGIFDEKTGREFLRCILEPGGSRDPLDLFIEFRGRAPRVEALLEHYGIL